MSGHEETQEVQEVQEIQEVREVKGNIRDYAGYQFDFVRKQGYVSVRMLAGRTQGFIHRVRPGYYWCAGGRDGYEDAFYIAALCAMKAQIMAKHDGERTNFAELHREMAAELDAALQSYLKDPFYPRSRG